MKVLPEKLFFMYFNCLILVLELKKKKPISIQIKFISFYGSPSNYAQIDLLSVYIQ